MPKTRTMLVMWKLEELFRGFLGQQACSKQLVQ
jgi:hypothetical protein